MPAPGDLPNWVRREIERAHREHALDEFADGVAASTKAAAGASLYVALYRERYGVTLPTLPRTLDDDRLTMPDCQRCADLRRRLA